MVNDYGKTKTQPGLYSLLVAESVLQV